MTWWQRGKQSAQKVLNPPPPPIPSLPPQTPSHALQKSLDESVKQMELLQEELTAKSAWLRTASRRLMDKEDPPTEIEIRQAEADLIELQRELGDREGK